MIGRGAVSPDHIHMLGIVSRRYRSGEARAVLNLKVRSSRKLQDEFPELRRQFAGIAEFERDLIRVHEATTYRLR